MAQVTFSGDPRNPGTDPAKLVMHGVMFPLGKPVEIEDEAVVAKFRSHSHFTVEGEAPVEPAKPSKADHLAKARAAKAAKAEKIDA